MMSFPSSNPSTPIPTQTPTLSSSPTASPHPTVFCEDVSDWVDTWNNNCDDYASNNMCKYYYVIGTNGLTAGEACCGERNDAICNTYIAIYLYEWCMHAHMFSDILLLIFMFVCIF